MTHSCRCMICCIGNQSGGHLCSSDRLYVNPAAAHQHTFVFLQIFTRHKTNNKCIQYPQVQIRKRLIQQWWEQKECDGVIYNGRSLFHLQKEFYSCSGRPGALAFTQTEYYSFKRLIRNRHLDIIYCIWPIHAYSSCCASRGLQLKDYEWAVFWV